MTILETRSTECRPARRSMTPTAGKGRQFRRDGHGAFAIDGCTVSLDASRMPDAQNVTAVKTAVFKLHNPSRRKRAMLDHALRQNHLAYTKALRNSAQLVGKEVAAELEARANSQGEDAAKRRRDARDRKLDREKRLRQHINATLLPLPICLASKHAGSVPNSIVGQVESHIELHGEQQSVGLPTVRSLRPKPILLKEALASLSRATTKPEEDAARDRLASASRPGEFRPMLFATNRKSDGFLLLRDETAGRYFVWLNLVPSCSRFTRLTETEKRERSCRHVRELTDLRTGEIVSFRSKTGCLFPVAFGRDFQLDEFVAKGSPLSAKLTKKGDCYEVHVSFEYVSPRIETTSFLGIDRGIYNLASLAVVDGNGRVLERKNVDGRELRYVQKALERRQRRLQRRGRLFKGRAKLHAADEAVHKAANEIVTAALRNRSQIVMENLAPLASRGKKRGRSNFNRVLNRSQYQKLQKVLDYKLKVVGLPPPREVHPGYTSQACPICGRIDGDNRAKIADGDGFKMDVFRCVACEFTDDADLNAARNIALKHFWRNSLSPALKTKPFKEVPENKNFTAFLRNRATLRGERPCDRKIGSSGGAGLDGHEDGEVPPGGGVPDTVRPLSLTPDRTPRQEKISSAKQPTESSSSGILPPPEAMNREIPDG